MSASLLTDIATTTTTTTIIVAMFNSIHQVHLFRGGGGGVITGDFLFVICVYSFPTVNAM